MPRDYVIRELTSEDAPVLWDMVHQALESAAGKPLPREVIEQPEFARYVEGWPRESDIGFCAKDSESGFLLGAAWIRVFTDLPHPAAALAFSVNPAHRRRGIGAALLTHLVKATPQHSAISIRAAANNPAVRLYERFGFRIIKETPDSVLMRRDI